MLTLIATLLLTQAPAPGQAQPAPADCALTPEGLALNRTLGFADFDQRGVAPSTARALDERGCESEAARATEDYLLFGPQVTEYQKNVLSWHLAQYLASAGREGEAAHVIATTRRAPTEEADGFDWNTYIVGTWSFLVKDRAGLDQAVATLGAGPGVRNSMNTKVLRRLQKCFDRSYNDAYTSSDCAVD
jgi:hypothetical protein